MSVTDKDISDCIEVLNSGPCKATMAIIHFNRMNKAFGWSLEKCLRYRMEHIELHGNVPLEFCVFVREKA